MTIDMHAHWSPPSLIPALRERTTPPRVVTRADGADVLDNGRGETPLADAFDDVDRRLAEMDRFGITTAVLSLFGQFQWIERLPVEESVPLVRLYNDSVSEMCRAHPGRFAAYASLPQRDMGAAAAEFERALGLPGIIGAILPGNGFLSLDAAEPYKPLFEVADRHGALIFIHWGPRPDDAWPRVKPGTDNAHPRLGTLDMQASLSSVMLTLGFSDYLDAYPNARVQVHNLGGNIPFEIERMDHRCLMDTPDLPLPSTRFKKPNLFVDCNSFGARAIELGVRLYGADKILFATDGTAFSSDWSVKALAEAEIGDEARRKILHDNAAGLLGKLTELAPTRVAAE